MQELLRNAGRQLESLLTPSALLQLAALLIAILLACGSGGRCATPTAGRRRWCRRGVQARIDRSAADREPAPRGACADRGVRRRSARPEGRKPHRRPRNHARRPDASHPPGRVHGSRLARKSHQGLGQRDHVRDLGSACAARAWLVRPARAGARQRRHQGGQDQNHSVVRPEDSLHRRRLHPRGGVDRALVRAAPDGACRASRSACASASRSSRRPF